MAVFTIFGSVTPAVLVVFYSLQNTAAATAGKEAFSYEYLDTESTILKLRCDGGCSTGITVLAIVINNHTSMTQLCAATPEKSPTVIKPPVQDISYFVAGGLSEKDDSKSCHLELLITNSNLLTRLHFGCNVSYLDSNGIISKPRLLAVDRKGSPHGTASPHGGPSSISTITLIILIAVIVFLFFLSVFFLSMWLRKCCRDRLTYQMSPQRKVSDQVYQGDTASVVSYASSPAIDMKDSEFKFQPRNASVRRMNSRSEANFADNRAVYPVPPPAPPPQFLREKYNSQRTNSIKVPYTYARPQDAIESDFSEDGDVASSIGATRNLYFQTNKPQDSRQGPTFYASSAINNQVDV